MPFQPIKSSERRRQDRSFHSKEIDKCLMRWWRKTLGLIRRLAGVVRGSSTVTNLVAFSRQKTISSTRKCNQTKCLLSSELKTRIIHDRWRVTWWSATSGTCNKTVSSVCLMGVMSWWLRGHKWAGVRKIRIILGFTPSESRAEKALLTYQKIWESTASSKKTGHHKLKKCNKK